MSTSGPLSDLFCWRTLTLAMVIVAAGCDPATDSTSTASPKVDATSADTSAGGDPGGSGPDATAPSPDAAVETTSVDGGTLPDASTQDATTTPDAAPPADVVTGPDAAPPEDTPPTPDAASGECATHDDCPSDQWCRQANAAGDMECVPYVQAGDACGGFTLPWMHERCVPELSCLGDPAIADAPGICGTCWHEGAVYQAEESFDASDGCNTCTCTADGAVGCTKIACAQCSSDDDCAPTHWCRPTQDDGDECVPYVGAGETCGGYTTAWAQEKCVPELSCLGDSTIPDLPGQCGTCWYEGAVYQVDDTFDAADGCNTCTCTTEGVAACTKKACPPPCPDGTEPVQCLVDPCSVSTCEVEGATCTANTCGGCFAEWTTPDGAPVCNGCTVDDDCAADQWCRQASADPDDRACVPYVDAGDLCGGFTLPWLYEQCMPGLSCLSDPQIADAPGICGTCWYEGAVYQAEESFDASDGCNTCTCTADGAVGCTKIACAQCSSDDDCAPTHWCRPTQDDGDECVPYVGAGETCGGYTTAWAQEKCVPELSCLGDSTIPDLPGQCGTCWYQGAVYQADDTFDAGDDCNTCTCTTEGVAACTEKACPPPCPDGTEPVQCLVDPCSVSTCEVEGATCTANTCGGCFAEWTTPDGASVCNGCTVDDDCAADQWCRQASADPDDRACVPYVDAGDLCGGFTLPWFYEQCMPGLSCLSDPQIADAPGVCGACWYEGEVYQADETFDAGDGCNTCSCSADGVAVCTKIGCPPLCADGSVPVQCFVDPCSVSECETKNASCTPNYCGGCFAEWTTPNGNPVCNSCESDDDCASDKWCRMVDSEGAKECVPYVGPGETCGGYTLPWLYEQCLPDLLCLSDPMIADLPGECGACWVEGTVYQAGESFPAGDGCNTCSCGPDGSVMCTLMACP